MAWFTDCPVQKVELKYGFSLICVPSPRMYVGTSYREIWKISAPIMIGSAAQSVIALTDSVFLYYLSEEDFASIGFVATFYLIISAIGFGFSRGGQILIARRVGENQPIEAGRCFYAMLWFELALATVLFFFMTYGCEWLFKLTVDSEIVLQKSLEYIETRKIGVFAAYAGVAFIAFYMGIARPAFIIVSTVLLAAVNIALDYLLIFGQMGLPRLGISGAGIASSLAEYVALIAFLIYVLLDWRNKRFRLRHIPHISLDLIRLQVRISLPMVAQAMVGLGSSFLFFGLVENLGERALAITNLARITYLVLSVPCWGFSSGINTIVSNYIGRKKRQAVIPILWRTAQLCLLVTLLFTIPIVLFPTYTLYPLFGNTRIDLILEARPVFYVLGIIMIFFSVGSIFLNGLIGAGATAYALKIQFFTALFYLGIIYLSVKLPALGLTWAWSAEIFYWIIILIISLRFLYSKQWYQMKV